MTYEEKKQELEALLESINQRIKRAECALDTSRYGRRAARRHGVGPSRQLFVEQSRLRLELEGLDYEQSARLEQ